MMFQKTLKYTFATAAAALLAACVIEGPGSDLTKFKEKSRSEKVKDGARIKTQLAVEYVNARDYRQAVATIEQAIKDDSKFDMAWLIRAQIYQFLKQYDKTEESFRQAFALNPTSAEVNNNYGWYTCEILKQPAQSIKYFDIALMDTTYPTPEIAWLNKGICTARAGQINMADSYFERALGMNPDFVTVYRERARLKLESNQIADADRYFKIYQSRVNHLLPGDLLLGWKLARAQGETQAAYEYEAQLRTHYPHSEELQSISAGSTK